MKKKLILIFACFSILISQEEVSGPVSGTWTLDNSPYLIIGDIQVDPYTSLAIDPGVEVQFMGDYNLLITGELQAIGTQESNITFSCIGDGCSWGGINFQYSTGASYITYAEITNTHTSALSSYYSQDTTIDNVYIHAFSGYALNSNDTFTDLTLSNSLIEDGGNNYYINSENTYLILDGVILNADNPGTGTGLYYGGNIPLSIRDSEFNNFYYGINIQSQSGGAYHTIINTNFENCNLGTQINSYTNIEFDNCKFINNDDRGIDAGTHTSLKVYNSLFQDINNYAIYINENDYIIDNCTFLDNNYGFYQSGYSQSEVRGEIKNSIFEGHGNSAIRANSSSYGPDIINTKVLNNNSGIIEVHDIYNCIVANNDSNWAVENSNSLINSTVVSNYRGAYNVNTVKNSIIFFNANDQIQNCNSVTYSNIMGGYSGEGNTDQNPGFSDFYNFELHPSSPCIDAGDPSGAYNDLCFPPSQGEALNDIGVYGGPNACGWITTGCTDPEADNYDPTATIDDNTCEYDNISIGDLDQNNIINIIDIVILVNLIISGEYNQNGDINNDGASNVIDIVLLVDLILSA